MRHFLRNNGLSIVLLTLFFSIWIGQTFVGRSVYNDEQRQNHEPEVSLSTYLRTGHFVEATFENWESEFLQMSAFVWLTRFLFQKGSPESNDPDDEAPEPEITPTSPRAARMGGLVTWLYSHSLSIAFFGLFLLSIIGHAAGGACEYSEEQRAHGEAGVTFWQYLATAQFWFESLQNWQSEFLAIAAMVILSIFLREKGSPESKAVAAPTDAHE